MARKQPKQKRSQMTVKYILEGAKLCISKYGINKISTLDISKVSGVGVGSIYQYFKNKEDIHSALVEAFANESNQLFESINKEIQPSHPIEDIDQVIDQMCDRLLEHRPHIRGYYSLIPRLGLTNVVLGSRRTAVKVVKKTLIDKYKIPEDRAHILSFGLFNSFIGIIHTHILENKPVLSDQEIKSLITQMTKDTILAEMKRHSDLN